jgi:hypothetical protein
MPIDGEESGDELVVAIICIIVFIATILMLYLFS